MPPASRGPSRSSAHFVHGNRAMTEPGELRAPIVGGPVCTRTADRSLHVSLMPSGERRCTFACLYCPFPRARHAARWPPPGDVGAAVTQALQRHPDVESITVSGAGEPTLHPAFGRALGDVLSARRTRPDLPVRIVTNGTTALEPRVRRLLALADERIVRVDAGAEKLDRPLAETPREAITAALRELPDFSAESFFLDGPAGNTGEREVEEWLAWLAELRPRRVYVTTVPEPPLEPALRRADARTLERIAAALRERTGLEVVVLP